MVSGSWVINLLFSLQIFRPLIYVSTATVTDEESLIKNENTKLSKNLRGIGYTTFPTKVPISHSLLDFAAYTDHTKLANEILSKIALVFFIQNSLFGEILTKNSVN